MSERRTVPAERLVEQHARCVTCGAIFDACDCRPDMTDDGIPVVTHTGYLQIGRAKLAVHVLSNGERVFDVDSFADFLLGVGEA